VNNSIFLNNRPALQGPRHEPQCRLQQDSGGDGMTRTTHPVDLGAKHSDHPPLPDRQCKRCMDARFNPGGRTYRQKTVPESDRDLLPFQGALSPRSWQVTDDTGQGRKTQQELRMNWSPFPDGALQFRLYYMNTSGRKIDEERSIIPGVIYKITIDRSGCVVQMIRMRLLFKRESRVFTAT